MVNGLRLTPDRTGPGRHIEYVVQQWSRMTLPFDRVVLLTREPAAVEDLGSVTPVDIRSFAGRLPALVWEQVALPVRARGAAVLFCPAYTAPLLHRGPMVVANHGIYEALPGEFSRLDRLRTVPLFRASAHRAGRVIANSKPTRDDLVRYFGLPADSIDVIHPAPHDVFFRDHPPEAIAAEVERALGEQAPYLLFVGKLAKRRNIPNLVEAFARVRAADGDIEQRLLIVGPNTTDLDVAGLAGRHGVADAVTYIPYREPDELALLYAGADAFVLPTVYEGISQTMFEAMASGAPVLTVDHPTLDEGGGGAVLSVPEPSVEHLADGLRRIMTDPALRADLSARGREHAAGFSWTKVAESTAAILDRVGAEADAR